MKQILRRFQIINLSSFSVGVKSGRNWHARTPKVTLLNPLFFALCLPKIYNPGRCTFEEATDSESQKISSDLFIVCWRKRGFIAFARHANIGHFFLRLRAHYREVLCLLEYQAIGDTRKARTERLDHYKFHDVIE